MSGIAKGAAAGAGAAVVGAPMAASAIGFTSSGIAAGSYAASMMSVLGGAATPAGGVVATLQAVGATGSIFVSAPAVIGVAVVGVGIGAASIGVYKGARYLLRKSPKQE